MRPGFAVCLTALGLSCCFVATAPAMKLNSKTKTYGITGDSGQALLAAMDRRGPKQGFMAHAIAQTAYTVDWELKVRQNKDVCELAEATGTLNLTYTYPAVVSDIAPSLHKRWKRFFAGVRAHEQTHGRIAAKMVRAMEKSLSGLRAADDRWCWKTRREARRRIDGTYAAYEARQIAFDKREHGRGGRVEKLVADLVRKR